MKDKISIITSYYNNQDYIIECIESINKQLIDNELYDVEHILVNDNSTDNSETLIKEFINHNRNPKIDFILLTTPKNLGCGGARKFGIENASGNYFMFLDGDDYYINNDFINRAYNLIKNHDADIVEFGYRRHNINNNQIDYKYVNSLKFVKNNSITKFEYLCNFHIINYMVWTKIIKKSIIDTKEYDVSRTYEDIKTTPYWIYNANKIIINPSVEINYRNNINSIINDNIITSYVDIIKAVSSLFEYFKFDKKILIILYKSIYNELQYILLNFNSENKEFNEVSKINSYMLNYIFNKN